MQMLNWAVQRKIPIASWVVEGMLSLLCLATMRSITQGLPPLALTLCITTGIRTTLMVATLLVFIIFVRGLITYFSDNGTAGSNYRSVISTSTPIVLGILLTLAIWASERAQYPMFAFGLSISMIMGIFLVDQTSKDLSLEFISHGRMPTGVVVNEDSEEDIVGPIYGKLGDEGVEIIGETDSVSIPEYLVMLSICAGIMAVSFFGGAVYLLALRFTSLPVRMVHIFRSVSFPRFRGNEILGSWGNDENMDTLDDKFKDIRNGVYRIINNGLLTTQQRGAGVVKEKVFHTLMHITNNEPVKWRGQCVIPHSGNALRDVVTYGGPWNLKKAEITKEIDIMICNPDQTVNYGTFKPSVIDIDGEEQMFISVDFGYGSSGSPFFYDGTFNIRNKFRSLVVAYVPVPSQLQESPMEQMSDSSSRRFVDWHPGKGKTRKVIIEQTLQNVSKKLRTLILSPTRVVSREVLKAFGEQPDFKIGSSVGYCRNNLVTVACHATFTQYVLTHGVAQIKVHMIIMDECHFFDPFSIAARGIMEFLNQKGVNIVYLSATPPSHPPSEGSNFEIQTHSIKFPQRLSADWISGICRDLSKTKTIVFVPSHAMASSLESSTKNAVSTESQVIRLADTRQPTLQFTTWYISNRTAISDYSLAREHSSSKQGLCSFPK
ncbi:uncharacterized protein LOC135710868 [Ochlerotatus camptorhynchus]|uniref:uncharacterized protein LOC135710868 n=1 Tax=Ochlerotatus camptorhynchus TaxID=644619 RepID=UPI0031D1674D